MHIHQPKLAASMVSQSLMNADEMIGGRKKRMTNMMSDSFMKSELSEAWKP